VGINEGMLRGRRSGVENSTGRLKICFRAVKTSGKVWWGVLAVGWVGSRIVFRYCTVHCPIGS